MRTKSAEPRTTVVRSLDCYAPTMRIPAIAHLAALVLSIGLSPGCRQERAPPSGWRLKVDVQTIAEPCLQMIGGSFPTAVVDPRLLPRGIDLSAATIPQPILALSPEVIEVTDIDVHIELGSYPTGYADGEFDHYGLVCSRGTFSGQFQRMDGTTFLDPLGAGVYAYDSIL